MSLGQKLLAWYEQNRRDLPWRRTRNPYYIWVSEIMLQQTTVRVVVPYFEKFMERFPTVESLAQAPQEDVLSFWSGLGYYSRARNLQKAAQAIVARGSFPKTYAELLELPGIGPYTAAAVASIAFGEEVACVDGNVARVVSRLFDIDLDIRSQEGQRAVQERASHLVRGQNPSLHNQAMMELGATICTPQNPVCLLCPVNQFCQSFKKGNVLERPVKMAKRKQEPWLWTLFYVQKGKKFALVKNSNGTPWLKNTWVLPGKAEPWKKSGSPEAHFRHSITHHKIFVKLKRVAAGQLKLREAQWVSEESLKTFGVSSIVHKALKYVTRL